MDNQHRKIQGYRELSQAEVDLMNRIKQKGAELLALHEELQTGLLEIRIHLEGQVDDLKVGSPEYEAALAERDRFFAAEPYRWAHIGKTDVQTGLMALVRAVAQPAGV